MTPVSVAIEEGAHGVAAVLASLPRSFVVADRGDVTALGGGGDWPGRAASAIRAGARGVLVTEPGPVDPVVLDRLVEVAMARGAALRLARQWASNPAVAAFAAEPRGDAPTTLVDAEATLPAGTAPVVLLAAQVDLVLAALGGRLAVTTVARTVDGYQAVARLVRGNWDDLVLLTGVATNARRPQAAVRELLFDGRRSVALQDGAAARPATALIGDAAGERWLPTIYETGYRATWRALRADLDGTPGLADIVSFRASIEVVAAVGDVG